MRLTNADDVVINHGVIISGTNTGISSGKSDATIINEETGTIVVSTRPVSYGILSSGAKAMITNSGTIEASGNSSYGIFSSGPNAKITNSGTIEASGNGFSGIRSFGPNAKITNSGTIEASGNGFSGILSSGANAIITNSGTIEASGSGSHGINSFGANAIITISGHVSVTGSSSFAVRGSDENDQTLTLLPGARISGRINLGEKVEPTATPPPPVFTPDNDVLNIVTNTAASSRTYVTEGVETFGLGALAMRNGDTVAVIDPTGQSATRITLGMTTGRIHRQVFQRLTSVRRQSAKQGAWGSFLGGYAQRGGDGLAQAWRHDFYGGVGGFDARLPSGQRVGVFAGGGRGHIRTSGASLRDRASRAFFGTYGQQSLGKLTFDGSVLFGYARHDSTRRVLDNLVGYEAADGGYNSFHISPSLAMTYAQALGSGFELRPGVQIAYTYGHYGSYTESGTANSNISFKGRGENIVDGRMQLALARTFADDRGEIEWRGGATLAHYRNDGVDASLGGGTATSYRVPGDNVIHGGYAGVRLHYAINDYITAGGDFEYVRRSGHEDSVFGYLRCAVQF